MEKEENTWITGFWKRIGALLIDGLILGFVGFLLGLALEEYFVQIGGWGRLIGFSIALIYFGVLNSTINNGQTVGKALLNINVVDSNNNNINVLKSFLRYCILGTPFYLNNARFTEDLLSSPFLYILSFVIFGGFISVIYLYAFNRHTRQSLHDVIVGTYVTNKGSSATPIVPIWKFHFAVVVFLFIAAAVAPYFTMQLAQQEPFIDMLNVRSEVMKEPVVVYANLNEGVSTVTTTESGTSETTYITVQAFLAKDDISNEIIATDIGKIIINNHKNAASKDLIQVTLTYGYDIGIWSYWKNHNHQFTPNDLN